MPLIAQKGSGKSFPCHRLCLRLHLAEVGETLGSALDEPGDEALFQSLRARRTELARTQGVPPYVIFHDSMLVEIAHRRPCDADELAPACPASAGPSWCATARTSSPSSPSTGGARRRRLGACTPHRVDAITPERVDLAGTSEAAKGVPFARLVTTPLRDRPGVAIPDPSDQFGAFYTKVIAATAHEAPHILDGLLLHGTSLKVA